MFVLDRHVSTQRVDYQKFSYTKIRVSAHFLSYELISMRNVKHMTPCLTPNFPQTSRNDVQPHDFFYLRTLLCMQLLTYETMFECIVWTMRRTVRRVHCKKRHNFTQRFDLQGHARVQIFTYKDITVCNVSSNFPMLYDNRRVSTQISWICHVHAQVNTL